jgi:hypothetical protein
MHLNTAAALSAFLLPLASANCFGSGFSLGSQQLALDNIENAATMLQGALAGGQQRPHCLTDSSTGSQWFFSVKNKGRNYQTAKKEDIEKYLREEVSGCGTQGGASTHNWIEYM